MDDSLNGMIFNNVTLPVEVIVNIFKYINTRQLLRYRFVCKNWNEIITSHDLWFTLYKEKYKKSPKLYPWFLYYFLFNGYLDNNLLKNVNGEEKFDHWKITHNGGDGFKVENPPISTDPLPMGVSEFNKRTSCFATSFHNCCKSQTFYVKSKMLGKILNQHKPHIYVSEWVAARYDCGAIYKLNVSVVCKNKISVDKEAVYKEEQWCGKNWHKIEIIITDYPDDVDFISFTHMGRDTQFWKGHYGMKMAGGVVKFLFDTAKSEINSDS